MILDKEVLFADNLAYGGTPEIIDLGAVRPGPGEPIKGFIIGLTTLTACTGFSILDDADGNADEALMTVVDIPNTTPIEFTLPSNTKRYVTIALTGSVSAGTFTAGLILPGAQTNG